MKRQYLSCLDYYCCYRYRNYHHKKNHRRAITTTTTVVDVLIESLSFSSMMIMRRRSSSSSSCYNNGGISTTNVTTITNMQNIMNHTTTTTTMNNHSIRKQHPLYTKEQLTYRRHCSSTLLSSSSSSSLLFSTTTTTASENNEEDDTTSSSSSFDHDDMTHYSPERVREIEKLFEHHPKPTNSSSSSSSNTTTTTTNDTDEFDMKPGRRTKYGYKVTALYQLHNDIGCTWTIYNNYKVPLYYHHEQGGIIKEHNWCRCYKNYNSNINSNSILSSSNTTNTTMNTNNISTFELKKLQTPKASIFDLSYMTQYRIFGKDRIHFIERCCTTDIKALPMDTATFTCITNNNDNNNNNHILNDDDNNITTTTNTNNNTLDILDTGIISKCDDNLYLIVNGGNINRRLWDHFDQCMDIASNVNTTTNKRLKTIDDYEYVVYLYTLEKSHSLISIQGSAAAAVLQPLVPNNVYLHKLSYMDGIRTSIMDYESCRITRCGYSGEDGFIISLPHTVVEDVVYELVTSNPTIVNVAGLGAYNTLRTEAGLLQYNIDIDSNHNSMIETGYSYSMIDPRRKEEGGFLGAEKILQDLQHDEKDNNTTTTTTSNTSDIPKKKENNNILNVLESTTTTATTTTTNTNQYRYVGIIGMDRIVTADTVLYDGTTGLIPIGHVTTGIYSPTLQQPIAIAYILKEYSIINTPIIIHVSLRNGTKNIQYTAHVTTLPFVPVEKYMYVKEHDENVSDPDIDENTNNETYEPQFSTIPASIPPEHISYINTKKSSYDIIDDILQDEMMENEFYNNDIDDDEFLGYSNSSRQDGLGDYEDVDFDVKK